MFFNMLECLSHPQADTLFGKSWVRMWAQGLLGTLKPAVPIRGGETRGTNVRWGRGFSGRC